MTATQAGPMCFYLGAHHPYWLWRTEVTFPLFVSHTQLSRYKTVRPSTHPWALDSGGFSEISMFGEWRTSAREYVAAVARYDAAIGHLDWAAPQDWMCEPAIINGGGPGGFHGTHLSVAEHQARTVRNFVELCDLWPTYSDTECPFMPVLQGWEADDYRRCADLYDQAGVRLEDYPVVGLGSVCRRQGTAEITRLVTDFTPWLALHGFGMKFHGLTAVGHRLASADSMAWSYDARRLSRPMPSCIPHQRGCSPKCRAHHRNCANCPRYATAWRDRLLAAISAADTRGHQEDLFTGLAS